MSTGCRREVVDQHVAEASGGRMTPASACRARRCHGERDRDVELTGPQASGSDGARCGSRRGLPVDSPPGCGKPRGRRRGQPRPTRNVARHAHAVLRARCWPVGEQHVSAPVPSPTQRRCLVADRGVGLKPWSTACTASRSPRSMSPIVAMSPIDEARDEEADTGAPTFGRAGSVTDKDAPSAQHLKPLELGGRLGGDGRPASGCRHPSDLLLALSRRRRPSGGDLGREDPVHLEHRCRRHPRSRGCDVVNPRPEARTGEDQRDRDRWRSDESEDLAGLLSNDLAWVEMIGCTKASGMRMTTRSRKR